MVIFKETAKSRRQLLYSSPPKNIQGFLPKRVARDYQWEPINSGGKRGDGEDIVLRGVTMAIIPVSQRINGVLRCDVSLGHVIIYKKAQS